MEPVSTVAVVIITRDRVAELARTLRHAVYSPEVHDVVVVDNGSVDGTPVLLTQEFPSVVNMRVEGTWARPPATPGSPPPTLPTSPSATTTRGGDRGA